MGNVKLIKFSELRPDRVSWWDPTLNHGRKADDLLPKATKIWFRCPEAEDHVFQRPLNDWENKSSCPYCKGYKVANSNSLATVDPEIAKEFHNTKNGVSAPDKIFWSSNKKVWWKCSEGEDHEWQNKVYLRTREKDKFSCPFCKKTRPSSTYNLVTEYPEIANQWHKIKNKDLKPNEMLPKSNKKVWWKCDVAEDHEWESSIGNRTAGKGCPFCNGQKVTFSNSFQSLGDPELLKQWHKTLNKNFTPRDLVVGSAKKVWWKCDVAEDHVWQTPLVHRTSRERGCPFCSGDKITLSNSLYTLNPKLASEWNYELNEKSPKEISPYSHSKFWWKCDKASDHVFKARVSDRNQTNCPMCANKIVVLSNCLKTTNPKLAAELHPTKNGKLTAYDIHSGYSKKVWWKCDVAEDHEWESSVDNRSRGNGCPVCRGFKVVNSNSLQTLNPKLSNEWHPTLNRKLKPTDFTINSNKQIWWQCKKNNTHIWKTSIANRKNSGCPFCDLTPQSRQELIITFELLKFFKGINPKGYKTRLNGKLRAIDIFIPDLNLAIEFDGSYWHKDKRAIDKIKSEMLMHEGYQVIRIREQPLKKIHENDITSKVPYNGKEITNNILKRILELYSVKGPLKQKIQNYISKDGLQNEKALDKYIDQILEEKAAKKR